MKKQRRLGKNSPSDVHIPHEIVVQVLMKLPSYSLMRFKCVCKQWKTTISDPKFALSHRTLSQARLNGNLSVTFWRHEHKIYVSSKEIDQGKQRSTVTPTIVLNFKPDYYSGDVFVSGQLDGLACVYSHISNHALVLNITTAEIMHLPGCLHPYHRHEPYFPIGAKVYDASYTLGFDSIATKYKVLNLYSHGNGNGKVRCEIYTLGTPSRRVIDIPPSFVPNNGTPSNCINGTIYWLRYYEGEKGYVLIAFDVGKEMFRPIPSTVLLPLNWSTIFAIGEGRLLVTCLFGLRKPGHPIRLGFLEDGCGDNHCGSNNGDLVMETIAFEPKLRKTGELHVSGIRPTTGEIIVTDNKMSRVVYLDLEKRTCRTEQFKWPHPNRDESSILFFFPLKR